MNKAMRLVASDFPRTPALLFSAWIGFLVISDLLAAFGFVSEMPTDEERTDEEPIVRFVTFQTFDLGDYDISVGSQYQANDGSAPEKQWCYADKLASEGSHRIHITLAEKIGSEKPTYQAISETSASKLGLSSNDLVKLAKTHCNFL